MTAAPHLAGKYALLLQMAEETAAKLAAARLQMEQEFADARAGQNRAQVHSVAQPEELVTACKF